jgi:hypothetical protein
VRTIRVPGVPAGCLVADLARWRRVEAYILAPTHAGSCGPSQLGLWVRAPGRPPRRLAAPLVALGNVHRDVIGWIDGHRPARGEAALVIRIRAAQANGPARTLDFASIAEECDSFEFTGAVFDEGHLYWSESCSGIFNVLMRSPIALAGRHCVSFLSDIVSSAQPRFDWAVDRGHVYYATDRGVMQVAPDRLHWPADRCHRR